MSQRPVSVAHHLVPRATYDLVELARPGLDPESVATAVGLALEKHLNLLGARANPPTTGNPEDADFGETGRLTVRTFVRLSLSSELTTMDLAATIDSLAGWHSPALSRITVALIEQAIDLRLAESKGIKIGWASIRCSPVPTLSSPLPVDEATVTPAPETILNDCMISARLGATLWHRQIRRLLALAAFRIDAACAGRRDSPYEVTFSSGPSQTQDTYTDHVVRLQDIPADRMRERELKHERETLRRYGP